MFMLNQSRKRLLRNVRRERRKYSSTFSLGSRRSSRSSLSDEETADRLVIVTYTDLKGLREVELTFGPARAMSSEKRQWRKRRYWRELPGVGRRAGAVGFFCPVV